MKYNAFILIQLISVFSLRAQVLHTIDEFTSTNNYYSAFNVGTGSVSTSLNMAEFTDGNSSLNINYSFNSGSGFFFSLLRNYGTKQQDYSYLTQGFSISHNGGHPDDQLVIRLWEDINGNGVFDGEDEVYQSTSKQLGRSGWVKSSFPVGTFSKVVGSGNSQIDLNRIRAWDVKISNSSTSAHTGLLKIDQFQLESGYTPPFIGNSKLNGSFLQLWNSTGCKCGAWSQNQWEDEIKKMKDNQLTSLIIQYSVYDDLSWYSPSNIVSVNYKMTTLNKIVAAAEKYDFKIHFGLYFDESWNSADKSSAFTYSSILDKHKLVIDELWGLFGNSSAFGGWYIPQEINDLEWQTELKKSLLFNWVKDVTDYTESISVNKPTMIAPFFNLWQPADILESWYNDFLAIATHLDRVYPQDGVGITLKNPEYHLPLYFSAIKRACENNGKLFGATIETFQQKSGWPIDNGTFSASSTSMEQLKKQLWAAEEHNPYELVQFSWSYMQPNLTASSSLLYDEYSSYVDNIVLNVNNKSINENVVLVYPNPLKSKVTIVTEEKIEGMRVYSVGGTLLIESKSDQIVLNSLSSGIYVLELQLENKVLRKKIIKE